MGTVPATTLIKNIRENLNEPVLDAELVVPDAGGQWKNSALLEHLNKGKDRLVDLIRNVKQNYFQTIAYTGITLNNTTKVYTLPADFRELVSINITTSGFEFTSFRKLNQYADEFKYLDRVLTTGTGNTSVELVYDIVSTGKIKFANFPPATLATSIDYIGYIADYTLSIISTSEIMDEWREFIEGYATMLALEKNSADPRYPVWRKKIYGDGSTAGELEVKVLKSVASRDDSEREYVEQFWV